MKFSFITYISLLLLLLFSKISSKRHKDDYHDKDREPEPPHDFRRDEYYYSNKIKKLINKYGFGKQPSIDRDDYKKAFMNSFRLNFDDFTSETNARRDYDRSYMENFIEQIFYKLMEGVDDEIPMDQALGLYEPSKILHAANEVVTKLGHPNLVEEIVNEVVNPKKDKKKKKSKKKKAEEADERIYDL